eukprot:329110_1
MPLEHQQQMLCAFIVALIVYLIISFDYYDESDNLVHETDANNSQESQSIGNLPAVNVYSSIFNTVFFKHYTGIHEDLYVYIKHRMDKRISSARNVSFKYTQYFNQMFGRSRKCKLDNDNRLVCFLHQFRTGELVWNAAFHHGWNITSISLDFFHILFHFVDEFYDDWVTEMSDEEKTQMIGMFDGYPLCYQTLDGSQFLTTKSSKLPGGVRRREYYCWKHRWPEGKNVQAKVSHYGHATEVMIGPGAANDSVMSEGMCLNDGQASTLVDDGYPQRAEFILPDGSEDHKAGRALVERYFSRLKMLWRMVGGVYTRGKRWHDLCLRAAFILTNMVVMFEGPLNTFDFD